MLQTFRPSDPWGAADRIRRGVIEPHTSGRLRLYPGADGASVDACAAGGAVTADTQVFGSADATRLFLTNTRSCSASGDVPFHRELVCRSKHDPRPPPLVTETGQCTADNFKAHVDWGKAHDESWKRWMNDGGFYTATLTVPCRNPQTSVADTELRISNGLDACDACVTSGGQWGFADPCTWRHTAADGCESGCFDCGYLNETDRELGLETHCEMYMEEYLPSQDAIDSSDGALCGQPAASSPCGGGEDLYR
jgi:hypothetical protein